MFLCGNVVVSDFGHGKDTVEEQFGSDKIDSLAGHNILRVSGPYVSADE